MNIQRLLFIAAFVNILGCAGMPDDQHSKVGAGSFPLLGSAVENFRLLDHEGKSQELYYYSDRKAVVLIWQGNGCPVVRQSVDAIMKLKETYEKEGVVFLLVNGNPQDERESIRQEAKEYGIGIPILEDDAQIVTEGLGVKRSGTAIVVDVKNGWKKVYAGAVDDRLGDAQQREGVRKEYLKDAIEQVLRGEEVKMKTSEVQGCLINLEGMDEQYTYTKDVGPIMAQKCLECHSAGGVGPWSMDDYETVKGWGPMVREVVRTKRMPPWNPDPHYGRFKNDMALTTDEVKKIVTWVENGMKRGNGEDPLARAPKPDHDQWHFGEPDLILTTPRQEIPANGPLPYRYVEADQTIPEDLWFLGYEMKSENPKIFHHSVAVAIPPGEILNNEKDIISVFYNVQRKMNLTIGGSVPGRDKAMLPENLGRFIPKGSRVFFEIHYTPDGKPHQDQVRIGLYFHKQKPEKEILKSWVEVEKKKLKIPPGAKDYQVRYSHIYPDNILVYSIVLHMHYRGKSMSCRLRYPDQTEEVLISLPHYQFQWQFLFEFETPKRFPQGSEIICESAFDNSAQNPWNPDPSKEVKWGLQSFNEMSNIILTYTQDDAPADEKK